MVYLNAEECSYFLLARLFLQFIMGRGGFPGFFVG